MKWLLRAGGAVLVAAASVYFLIFVYRTARNYDIQPLFSAPMIGAVAAAALCSASALPISSWAWGRLLLGTGVRFPTLQLNMIMGLTQIAKYLPGNIGQHLGRSAMSLQRGIPAASLFITLAIEVLLVSSAAVVVGVVGLMVPTLGAAGVGGGKASVLAVAALGVGLALTALLFTTPLLPSLTRWAAPGLAAKMSKARALVPPVPVLGAAFLAYALNYVLVGAGLYLIAFTAAGVTAVALPFFIGVFALSWVVGFVIPGAPAGLGVREATMAMLLAPVVTDASAVAIIICFRIATMLGDLIGLAWGCGLYLVVRETRPVPLTTGDSTTEGKS